MSMNSPAQGSPSPSLSPSLSPNTTPPADREPSTIANNKSARTHAPSTPQSSAGDSARTSCGGDSDNDQEESKLSAAARGRCAPRRLEAAIKVSSSASTCSLGSQSDRTSANGSASAASISVSGPGALALAGELVSLPDGMDGACRFRLVADHTDLAKHIQHVSHAARAD
jgi:hypothetical protein